MPVCVICRREFDGRPHAKTCSNACRMAKSRGRGKKLEYKRIWLDEDKTPNSCVVHSISHATGMAFKAVQAMLNADGSNGKKGYRRTTWEPVIRQLGFTEVIEARGRLLDELVLESGVWYLASVRCHMMAVRDGEYLDTFAGLRKRRKRLRSLWRLQPAY